MQFPGKILKKRYACLCPFSFQLAKTWAHVGGLSSHLRLQDEFPHSVDEAATQEKSGSVCHSVSLRMLTFTFM